MKKPLFVLAGLALFASAGIGSLATVSGADHRDGPLATANPTADINDVYAFRGANTSNLVLAISSNPLIAPSDNSTRGRFDQRTQFQIHIDRNGDLVDDVMVNIRVTSQADALIIEGLGAPITAPITPPNATSPIITSVGGVSVFAGLRDDPFFLDLTGVQGFVTNPRPPVSGVRPAGGGSATDSFAGTNILAIVIEAPVTAITGGTSATAGTISGWVSTTRDGSRVDRMAVPTINVVVVPAASKDAYNQGIPVTDAATFRPTVITAINSLRTAVDNLFGISFPQTGGPLGILSSTQVATALVPDIVTINFANPVQFPNGRRLQDDVVDTALGVVLNRGGAAGISDGVNANDKAFLSAFPYLAEPHVPAAPAAAPAPVTPPRTGDGNLLNDSGALWTMSAAMLAVALVFAGSGVYAALRARSR